MLQERYENSLSYIFKDISELTEFIPNHQRNVLIASTGVSIIILSSSGRSLSEFINKTNQSLYSLSQLLVQAIQKQEGG